MKWTVGHLEARFVKWQVSYRASLDQAAEIARARTRFDGGGWWRDYEMRLVVLPDGSACEVRHRQWSRPGVVHGPVRCPGA